MTKKLVSLELTRHDWGYGLAIVWDGEIDDAGASRTGGRSQSFYNAETLDAVAKSLRTLADSLAGGVVEPPPVQVPDVSADLSQYGFAFVLVRPGGATYRIDPLDVTLQKFPDQPENREAPHE